MGFFEAIKEAYANYINFFGRATRPEYWWFCLWMALLGAAFGILTFLGLGSPHGDVGGYVALVLSWLAGLVLLLSLIPSIALQYRRVRDAGHSGWWVSCSILAELALQGWKHGAGGFPDQVRDGVGLVLSLVGLVSSLCIVVFTFQRSRPY